MKDYIQPQSQTMVSATGIKWRMKTLSSRSPKRTTRTGVPEVMSHTVKEPCGIPPDHQMNLNLYHAVNEAI
ncbi:hypothetical protein E2C01_007642 [Portunus trituberculatus]|uniref:Uncharacterized protein n=1 Tax=Portunus trituberculatus TaxID=210409 RepID=A0A5B7D2Y0_PORTR|nr:hypothetical protein [Portunus trituberculatus]